MKKFGKHTFNAAISLILSLVILLSASFIPSVAANESGNNYGKYLSIIGKYIPSAGKYLQKLLTFKNAAPSRKDEQKPESIPQKEIENKNENNNESRNESTDALSSYESEVLRLVNEERAKYGLKALKNDMRLVSLARLKSKDMHDLHYFSHESPTYNRAFDMMKKAGISYSNAGENIAMGYPTPEAVVDAWMNSPGHRANILSGKYSYIGVGYEKDGHYCTQMFIG